MLSIKSIAKESSSACGGEVSTKNMAVTEDNLRILKFPENEKIQRQNFISPFNRKQEAIINWQTISKGWKGYLDPENLTETKKKLLDDLSYLQMCSNIQLGKYYLIQDRSQKRSMKAAKEILKKMGTNGLLVRHELCLHNSKIPIYTLGPAGARAIDIPYTPNWWLDRSPYLVLRQLITNQLFFRFKLLGETKYYPTPYPLNGVIVFKGLDFHICITNGKDIPDELKWEKDRRLIVISETIEELYQSVELLKNNLSIRYTTDYDLFTIELHQAFCKYDSTLGKLIPITIPGFAN
jgi:hypothetical protein